MKKSFISKYILEFNNHFDQNKKKWNIMISQKQIKNDLKIEKV